MSKTTLHKAQGVRGACKTGKARFRDQHSAKVALARAQRDPNPKRQEHRFYRCPECAGWHLSSKEPVA